MEVENKSIMIRRANLDDLSTLYPICRQSYTENFGDHWIEGGLEWYLEKVYGWDALSRDLVNPGIYYFIAFYNGEPAGFMKVKLDSPLTMESGDRQLEIEKLYFLLDYQGIGLGKRMIAIAMALGKEVEGKTLWLGVIDTNLKAIEFYKKTGFTFFDKVRLEVPYFKDELRGMWRLTLSLEDHTS